MKTVDPVWAGVAELSHAYETRALSPVDVVDALLARIRRRDPALHAYIAIYESEARLAAEAADRAIKSGHRVGPLHGVPIALKDLIDLQGRVTTGGSKVWINRVSPTTATLAERLIGAGMIVLGKTHTVEFAMGSFGTNTHLGTPWNPWDLRVHRTPGGSSSGSAVAVAAGLAPVAIGTDTGGSVRLPAAWCGVVGLKVTAGRISTYGVLPLSFTLDTPGPIARSVEDAALIFRVLSGPDPRDLPTLAWAPADPLPTLRRGVAGLRLATLPDNERVGVDAEGLAAYDASVKKLAGLGAGTGGACGGDPRRQGRSVGHGGVHHARGPLPRAVRPRAADRLHRRRPVDVAPDPVPRGAGGDRAPHRLGLRAGGRVEGAAAAGRGD